MKTTSIEVKQYTLTIQRGFRLLVLANPSDQTSPFNQLMLVFVTPLPPARGLLTPSTRFALCYVPMEPFSDIYHLVQTERPAFAHAVWDDADNNVHDAAVSTSAEPVGEGFGESVGVALPWWGQITTRP